MHNHIKARLDFFNIDTSHFRGMGWAKGIPSMKKKSPTELLRNEPLHYRRAARQLRRAMLECGVPHKCKLCQLGTEWNNNPITLDIDHEDGNWTNNNLENLRFLCPNCHSQQKTSGRRPCMCECGAKTSNRMCAKCAATNASKQASHSDKGMWPDELLDMASSTSAVKLAKMIGVSDTAVRKRLKKLGFVRGAPHPG